MSIEPKLDIRLNKFYVYKGLNMLIELVHCTETLLNEIACKKANRKDIAKTYFLSMKSSETVNWKVVNAAIVNRWSINALHFIKILAWNGKTFS